MTTGVPGLSASRCEPVDQRLRNGEAFPFHQRCLTVGAFGLDDQVHMRIHPVEPLNRPLDQDLLGRVEHGLAVVGEAGAAKGAIAASA